MSDIKIFQLASYVKPLPIENKQKNWVLNGNKNSFYQYVIDMNDDSSTNGSINKTYSDYIYGKGLKYTNGVQGLNDWVKLKSILSNKDLRKICTDFQVFTAASLEVIRTKGGDLSSIGHLPKQYVVPALENEDGEIESYWFSRNWANTNKVAPENFAAFGDSKEAIQIYYLKPYSVGSQYFETLDYNSGLVYAEMEREISNQNISYIQNSLSAGYILNIPDGKSLTDEEKDRLERKIKQKLTGSTNAGSFIMNFQGRDAGAITVDVFPVPDNIHKQYDSFDERSRQKIATAHRLPSLSIAGVISSSGFSNTADEMLQARYDLQEYIIKFKQKQITNALEEILVQYGINLDLEFIPLTEKVAPTTELSKHVCLSEEPNVDTLISLGEDLNADDWDILEDEKCDVITLRESELNTMFKFASVPVTPRKNSSQDTSLFRIRYKYAGSESGKRDFCKKIINADKLYREEDLNFKSVYNEDFAPKGASSYNVFLYKGGVNCKHWWQRVVMLKKDNGVISVNKARKMILELDPKERKDAIWEANDKKVAQSASPFNNWWSLEPGYRTI